MPALYEVPVPIKAKLLIRRTAQFSIPKANENFVLTPMQTQYKFIVDYHISTSIIKHSFC